MDDYVIAGFRLYSESFSVNSVLPLVNKNIHYITVGESDSGNILA